jgi:protein O-GlcNAc transferase
MGVMSATAPSPSVLHERVSRALQAGAHAEAERLLATAPIDANFNALRGIHAQLTGNDDAAIGFFNQVLAVRRNAADILLNKAQSLIRLQRLPEAVELLNDFVTHTASAAAYVMLSEIHTQLKDKASAVVALGKALARGARAPELVTNYWLARRDLCDWADPLPDFKISELTPAAATVLSTDPMFQRQVAEYFCRVRFPQTTPHNTARPLLKPTAGRRIKVGYLSADIHSHATAYLIAELFALHDKGIFETFCFSYGGDDGSAIRARVKDSAEHFIDVKDQPLPAVVQAIRDADVDILVDLKGHTRNHALAVLAQRVAPIQIHYLGHPGTIGAPFVDYLVADPTIVPPSHERFYADKILRLPHCYQINDRARPVAETKSRAEYSLPDGPLVLAAFNQTYKITPDIFALWMDVLRARPNTILWLFESVAGAEANLRAAAQAAGVDPARLYFAPFVPNDQHIARYRIVDVVMDTHPYGGHTTTSDALWVGTPVVTLMGDTYPSRVAASLLTNVGLPELITTTPTSYTAKIIDLIDNPGERTRLKMHLNSTRTSCPLFNTPQWVRDWEAILKGLAV